MMRICTLAALVVGSLCGLGGCQGDGGAVSVRWRLVDLATGHSWDANSSDIDAPDHSCCEKDGTPSCVAGGWVVRRVVVSLRDPATDAIIATAPQPSAYCSARELTSPFDLPPGTYAMSLDAETDDAGDSPAITPAPTLRQVVRGSIVNLNVVEIGVHPLPQPPLPTPDAGVTQ